MPPLPHGHAQRSLTCQASAESAQSVHCVLLQLDEAHAELQQAKSTDRSQELAAAEARIKTLQSNLQRKEALAKELQDRVGSLTRSGALTYSLHATSQSTFPAACCAHQLHSTALQTQTPCGGGAERAQLQRPCSVSAILVVQAAGPHCQHQCRLMTCSRLRSALTCCCQCRAAREKEFEQNGDSVQAQLRRSRADLARRDVQLQTAQRDAEQVPAKWHCT